MRELRTITMPPTLRYLGQQAFIGCTKLENVFLTGDCLGTFVSDAFGGAPDYQVRVFVPRFNASWETFVTTNETIVPMDDALVEKYRAKYPTGSLPVAMWTNGGKHIWFSDKPYDGPNALYIHGTPGKAGADKVSPAYGMLILGTGESIACTAPAAGTADGAFYRCAGSLLETEVSDHVWGNPVRAEGTTRVVTQEGTETKRLTWLWEAGGYRVETTPYGAGLGHVVLDPPSQIGDNNYEEGTTVTLTAVPDEGHVFRRWFGEDLPEDVATNPVATVVLDSGKTYRPIFGNGWLYDARAKTITDGNWTLDVTASATTNHSVTSVKSFEDENVVDFSTPVIDTEGTPCRIASVGGFMDYKKLTHVFLPDSLSSLSRSTFRNCNELIFVEPLLPAGLKKIGECSFSACYKLEGEVVLPPHRITWDEQYEGETVRGTFTGTKITSADLSAATMTSLPERMFRNCATLESVRLPNGLKAVPASFLQGCVVLTNVSPFLPETIRSVGSHAFHGCGQLRRPLLLQGTNAITFDHHHSTGAAFMETGIPEIKITAPIKRISTEDWEHTFRDMKRLHTITFPSTVTDIGDQIFLNDTALTNVYFTGEAPGVFSASSFDNVPSEQVILFIPRFKESWDAFRTERNVLPPTDEEIVLFRTKRPTVMRKPVGIWEPVAGKKVWIVHWATPEDRKRGTMLLLR